MILKRRSVLHQGFTLIELLVVIAIIAILIGLLLPAVQKVRDAMARAECQNNLRQIALALHSYHDNNRAFPPGFSATPGDNNRGWGWGTFILPFIEQDNVFRVIAPSATNFHPQGAIALSPGTHILQTRLNVFLCPGNQPDPINTNRGNYGTSSYVGFMGMHVGPNQDTKGNGVFFPRSRVGIGNIPDGTSNTAFIGERALGRVGAVTYSGGIWSGNYNGWASTIRHIDPSSQNVHTFLGTDAFCFSSPHTGGLNVMLGDGSVRFMNQNIDPLVQGYLASREDGQPFEMP